MEGQKEKALIRRRAFCTASNQSLDFLSHDKYLQKTLFLLSAQLISIYEYKYIEKADLGKKII